MERNLNMARIVIVAAKRTPQGRFLGALARYSAIELACLAGEAALESVDRKAVDLVIMGNVLSGGLGMNIARQVGVRLGVPVDVPAFTVNMMCASGMKAVMLACDAIERGEAKVVLCGGTESMSNAPFVAKGVRTGIKFGDFSLVDTLLRDGLVDSFDNQHMGVTAERLAKKYHISRQEQDLFALTSQSRYASAEKAGRFVSERISDCDLVSDEHPRPDTQLADLERLKPAFDLTGTVTAGNASGINDGAAMLVVTTDTMAERNGWKTLAVVESYASAGCDPALMGLGPVYAVRKLLEITNSRVDDYDAIELNEAFAAQSLACIKELALDPANVNRNGGAIAVGHPIGASGARLVTHLAQEISQQRVGRGLATLCVGGGMGVAMTLSAP
jgi:acetyl-CoA C-acetyltransferase